MRSALALSGLALAAVYHQGSIVSIHVRRRDGGSDEEEQTYEAPQPQLVEPQPWLTGVWTF